MTNRLSVGVGLFLLIGAAPVGTAQQHAPTIDVCRADAAVWGDQPAEIDYDHAQGKHVTDGTPNRTAIGKLFLREVDERTIEMDTCTKVDPDRFDSYSEIRDFYASVHADRFMDYIDRHNLRARVYEEDAAGER